MQVTAFRRDERVRKLLRPLLPGAGKLRGQSIYGAASALQGQIDAFEQLFQRMDEDGSGGIDKDEFESFFYREGKDDDAAESPDPSFKVSAADGPPLGHQLTTGCHLDHPYS